MTSADRPLYRRIQCQTEPGKKLSFDPRLSKSGFVYCNSCDNLSMGGTDNLNASIGDQWRQGPINAATMLNSSLNVAQFWDGRAAVVTATARQSRKLINPRLNPVGQQSASRQATGLSPSAVDHAGEQTPGLPPDSGDRR